MKSDIFLRNINIYNNSLLFNGVERIETSLYQKSVLAKGKTKPEEED